MKTILVSGGNRGIGLEICRQLDELGHQVIMGSRDMDKGLKAALSLSSNLTVRQLDVTKPKSIASLFEFLEAEIGKLDVLINNAGIGELSYASSDTSISGAKQFIEKHIPGIGQLKKTVVPILRGLGVVPQKEGAATISLQSVEQIMNTNFYGPWRMIQAFIPLLLKGKNPGIINVSSGMGSLGSLNGEYPGYSLSKSSLNALTLSFSKELKAKGISVNAMCPGWVKTDMGGPSAPRSVQEGADTAVWLAVQNKITSGKFYQDRKEINW